MPTDPLFRDDATLRSCEAKVVEVTGNEVILERTVFYPTGGGQPGDIGTLGAATVTDTRKGEDGWIVHLCDGDLPAVGDTVEATLDWDRAHHAMRMHTALHLLSVAIPLPVTGGSIRRGTLRLDFDMPEAPEDKEAIERRPQRP